MIHFVAAIVAVLCLGTLVASPSLFTVPEAGVYHFSFSETFLFFAMYFLPAYVVLGAPASYIISKLLSRWPDLNTYSVNLFFYALAGGIAGIIVVLIFGQLQSLMDYITVFVIGSVAAILYYHFYLLTGFAWNKIRKTAAS